MQDRPRNYKAYHLTDTCVAAMDGFLPGIDTVQNDAPQIRQETQAIEWLRFDPILTESWGGKSD